MDDQKAKVTFIAPRAMVDALERIAAEHERTLSAELRRIIRSYIEAHGTVRTT